MYGNDGILSQIESIRIEGLDWEGISSSVPCQSAEAKDPDGGVVWYSKNPQIDVGGFAKCASPASYSQIS